MWNKSSGNVSPEPGTGTASASVTCEMQWMNLLAYFLVCMIPVGAVVLDKVFGPRVVWKKKEIDKEV